MNTAHLAEGILHAYIDGELSALASLRCAWHLRRCAACRAALEEERRLERGTADLVARLGFGIDVDEGWQRFRALSAGVRRRRALTAWPALGMAAVALLTAIVLLQPEKRSGSGMGTAAGLSAQDVCCWNLDGGGPGDDGVFTLSREDQIVACVIVYDDIDGSETLTTADVIRYVSNPRACGRSRTTALPQRGAVLVLASVARSPIE